MHFFIITSVRFRHLVRLHGRMNDTEFFKQHILPLQPAMQRMAENLTGNEDDAADVVQDCFVSLWNEREKIKKVVNTEAWCITLVKRKSIDLLRRRRPTVEIDEQSLMAEEPPDEEDLQQKAMEMIERLPERQAQIIRLKHFDAKDTQGIATAMQISEGNVYTLLSRAYQSLKKLILNDEQ